MNNNLNQNIIKLIRYGSEEYKAAIALRYEVLRKPLNLKFTEAQLASENNKYHIGCFSQNTLIAYLMLEPLEELKIKMKQVVVLPSKQNSGVGTQLIKYAERFAIEKRFKLICCNARISAVPFYIKSGYEKIGEEFIEVTIPHFYMEKVL